MQAVLTIRTSGPGLHEFTAEVVRFVREAGVEQGLLTLFVQHTSCSLWVMAARRSGSGRAFICSSIATGRTRGAWSHT